MLCDNLYCWPCLYRWLHHHSNCHECPVCEVLIQEEKLVPLYGRGKTQTDPRSKSYPGIDVPHRPAGQRPETAGIPSPGMNQFPSFGFGLLGGFMSMAYAGMENFAISTAFGGLIPTLFNVQFHGFQDATVYGTTPGYPFGFDTFPSEGEFNNRVLELIWDGIVKSARGYRENVNRLLYFCTDCGGWLY